MARREQNDLVAVAVEKRIGTYEQGAELLLSNSTTGINGWGASAANGDTTATLPRNLQNNA
jgi:hypothetical protein